VALLNSSTTLAPGWCWNWTYSLPEQWTSCRGAATWTAWPLPQILSTLLCYNYAELYLHFQYAARKHESWVWMNRLLTHTSCQLLNKWCGKNSLLKQAKQPTLTPIYIRVHT